MDLKYKFSDAEIKKLLTENLEIIVDTREQQNQHILDYFDKHNLKYKVEKLDAGDYSVILTANRELGIIRDCYIPVTIEKKNSIDELASSFKDRVRFESEFIRAVKNKTKIFLLVEDTKENVLSHNYRSEYSPQALWGSIQAFEIRFDFTTIYTDKKHSGLEIYSKLRYFTREYLKN